MTDLQITLALALLAQVGKSCSHSTRFRPWARKPLIKNLPISDAYHAFSGIMWPFPLYAMYSAWEWDPVYWALFLIAAGTIWPLSKLLKGLTLREAMSEAFYAQIVRRVV